VYQVESSLFIFPFSSFPMIIWASAVGRRRVASGGADEGRNRAASFVVEAGFFERLLLIIAAAEKE
jgi:hypothetical protein